MNGSCACGACRFRLTAAPIVVHGCHCTYCQRETGSAFAVNAMIEMSEVEMLAGAPEVVLTPSASGKGQNIARCPTCRTPLWSNYAGAGEAIRFVRVGALENPSAYPPDIHIYTSSKLDWVVLPSDAPAVLEYYKAADFWPPESIARYKATRSNA